MNKSRDIVIAVLFVLLMITSVGWFVTARHNDCERYKVTTYRGQVVRTDMKTGKMEVSDGSKWVSVTR